jgi:hypothetical protein
VVVHNMKANHGYYIQSVPVKQKSFYKLTGWIKTENVGESKEGAGISIVDYFEVGGDFRGTNNWQFAELYVSTGPGTSEIKIMLQVGNYGAENTGKAWFDDISMTKINSLPPGALVTVMKNNKEETSQDSDKKVKTQDVKKKQQMKGTFALLIIIIIIVIIVGIAVIILIILTRKKPGDSDALDEMEDDEAGENEVDSDKT